MTKKMRIIRVDQPDSVTPEKVAESFQELLMKETICTMATLDEPSASHINNAFYAPVNKFDLTIWSSPSTQHSRNVSQSATVAVSIFSSRAVWGSDIHGAQIRGTMHLSTGLVAVTAFNAYVKRYPALLEWAPTVDDLEQKFESKLYTFTTQQIKVIDEARFGKENYVIAACD